MLRTFLISFTMTVAAAGALQAQTFRADNYQTVTAVSQNTFVTTAGDQFGARGAWCAAADYAKDVLNAPGNTRIYVREAVTRPGDQVVFGVSAGNTTPMPVSSVAAALRAPGSNLSLNHAYQYCHDARLIGSQ